MSVVISQGNIYNVAQYHISSEEPIIDMIKRPDHGTELIAQVYLMEHVQSKPDRFAAVLMHFSSPSVSYESVRYQNDYAATYDRCLSQWRVHSIISGDFGFKCCCSQDIEHLHYVRNTDNGNILLVGSSCINKFAPNSKMKDDKNRLNKFFYTCRGCREPTAFNRIVDGHCSKPACSAQRTSDKRICRVCLNLRQLNGHPRCKGCWKNENDNYVDVIIADDNHDVSERMRLCSTCSKTFYADADFKTQCLSCWKAQQVQPARPPGTRYIPSKAHMYHKLCATCHQQFATSESSKTTCDSCPSLYKSCTTCNQSFPVVASELEWRNYCSPCYKKRLRNCQTCGKSFNPKYDYAKVCFPCYNKHKS